MGRSGALREVTPLHTSATPQPSSTQTPTSQNYSTSYIIHHPTSTSTIHISKSIIYTYLNQSSKPHKQHIASGIQPENQNGHQQDNISFQIQHTYILTLQIHPKNICIHQHNRLKNIYTTHNYYLYITKVTPHYTYTYTLHCIYILTHNQPYN